MEGMEVDEENLNVGDTSALMDRDIQTGTLDQLRTLEKHSNWLTTVQKGMLEDTKWLDKLKREYLELSTRKQMLVRQLQTLPSSEVADILNEDHSVSLSRGEEVRLGRFITECLVERRHVATSRIQSSKIRSESAYNDGRADTHRQVGVGEDTSMKYFAYRLLGKTFYKLSGNQYALSISTFFEGIYYENYTVVLLKDEEDEFGEDSGQGWEVFRHTIPHFVPLKELASEFLQGDIALFADKLRLHLNSYVARRESMKKLQREHKEVLQIESSVPFDFIVVSCLIRGMNVEITFQYSSTLLRLPDEANVLVEGRKPANHATLTSDFVSTAPSEGMERLKGNLRV